MENYIPDIYQPSIFDIDFTKLKKRGIKCLLIDLDNTIASMKEKKPSWKVKKLFKELKEMGFKVILFTNCTRKKRIEPFRKSLDVDVKASAKKPKTKSYTDIMNYYKFTEDQVAIVGDQVYTDILGGNRVGITTVLVPPISKIDFLLPSPNRVREFFLFKKLSKKDLFRKKHYYE